MTTRLPLNNDFFDMIRSGKKTATIRRRWRYVEIGNTLTFYKLKQRLRVSIVSVQHKLAEEITASDAKEAGGCSLRQCMDNLAAIYPGFRSDNRVTVIRFKPL